MISSALLHFGSASRAEVVIEVGVAAARRAQARVRGLTMVDTRRLVTLAAQCEAAVGASGETARLDRVEEEQEHIRLQVSEACLAAGLDFDLRRARGNPFEVLPFESQFHDLVITSSPELTDPHAGEGGLSPPELVDLLVEGVRPLLVLRRRLPVHPRVLLVNDGTATVAHAWRLFLQQQLFPEAELRVLAVGKTEKQARATLGEMADYCRARGRIVETGWLCGAMRRVVTPYALKWGADVVVLGVPRDHRLLRRMLGAAAEQVLQTTNAALYAVT